MRNYLKAGVDGPPGSIQVLNIIGLTAINIVKRLSQDSVVFDMRLQTANTNEHWGLATNKLGSFLYKNNFTYLYRPGLSAHPPQYRDIDEVAQYYFMGEKVVLLYWGDNDCQETIQYIYQVASTF